MCVLVKNGTSGNGERYHGSACVKTDWWLPPKPTEYMTTAYSARLAK